MVRTDVDNLREKYNELFCNDELKARAFDKIAENYYLGNFGSMQKSDIEVLLFSLFIERILKKSEDDLSTYSDYTLAKQLGVTQSKISALKVKKQLQYPYDGFDWKKSFERVCKNARYENKKIYINLRDRNLYYELKNAVDEKGGFVETTLTSNLLVISVADFYDLTQSIMSQNAIGALKKAITEKYHDDRQFCEEFDKKPLGKTLKTKFGDTLLDVVFEVIKNVAPGPLGAGFGALKAAIEAIKNNQDN